MEQEKMSVEDFKKYCSENSYSFVDDYDMKRFPITCGKCKSNEIIVAMRPEEGKMGSEYTGYMYGYVHEASMIVKCISCGEAMIVTDVD